MTMLGAIRKAVQDDPIGGSMLIDEIVYSYLADQAEQLRPDIEQLYGAFMADRVAIAKRSLGRSYVEAMLDGKYPDESVQKNAQWIADIEFFITDTLVQKDELQGSSLSEFNRKHPRGQGGRFRQGLPQPELNPKHEVLSKPFERLSPVLQHSVIRDIEDEGTELREGHDQEAAAKEQHQYEQANRVVSGMLRNFSGKSLSDINLIVNLTEPGGRKYSRSYPADKVQNGFNKFEGKDLWNLNDKIDDFEIEAKPTASDVAFKQVVAYNTLGNTGNAALASLATVDPSRLNNLAGSLNRADSQKRSKLGNFFNRLNAGGAVMQQTPGMEKYGDYARFVGALGPQAEEALGPYARQAAYRYRGTEKEPDLELVRQFNGRSMRAVDAAAGTRTATSDISDKILAAATERASQSDLALQAGAHQINNLSRTRGGAFTPDELKLNTRSDVAAYNLLQTLPDDPFVAQLSEQAGNVLPSQGVIIDADGDVVSQSVGFSDDHYLPFDLKNLKSLRGGQYVRTRQKGGLTGEDIYTSVRTGTRMATVVSSSGVYSLEFDPNFRGARASSDKARSMYDRYLKILDAVENSGLYVQDISPAEKAELRAQANSMGDDEHQTLYKKFLKERRESKNTLDEGTIMRLQGQAEDQASGEGLRITGDRYNRRVNEIYEELADEELRQRVSELKLNAKGYAVALQTLQQQFPYFIRNVSYQPLTSKQQGEGFLQNLNQSGKLGARQTLGSVDSGYVRPGGIRAATTRTGFWNPSTQEYDQTKNKDFYGGGEEEAKTKEEKAVEASVAPKVTGVPKSAFLNQVESYAGGQKEIGLKAARGLDAAFSAIPADKVLDKPAKEKNGTEWAEAKDFDDALALQYLLHPGNGGIANHYEVDPQRVASLLSNENLVKDQVKYVYNLADVNAMLGGFGDSVESMAKKIVEVGKIMKNAAQFQNPFAPQVHGVEGAFYTGDKPQSFPELAQISDAASINAVLSKYPAVADAYNDLKNAEGSGNDVDELIRENISVLKKVSATQKSERARLQSGELKIDDFNEKSILGKAGVTTDEWASALGNARNIAGYYPDKPLTQFSETVVEARAKSLQMARSLLVAERLVEAMAGGEPAPKAEPPSEGASEPTAKSLSKGYSSQRVQVVSKNHPLSREIQMRKSLNLPLVSKRLK